MYNCLRLSFYFKKIKAFKLRILIKMQLKQLGKQFCMYGKIPKGEKGSHREGCEKRN